MTHAELKQLLEAQAEAAQTDRDKLRAKKRVAIFVRLAATTCNIPHGRLGELNELVRLAPIGFSRVLGEVGISIAPRHAPEFVAIVVNRMRAQGSSSGLYAPKGYREVLRR